VQLIIPRATKQTQRRFKLQVYETHFHAFSSTSSIVHSPERQREDYASLPPLANSSVL
jgi:hypothetical protein